MSRFLLPYRQRLRALATMLAVAMAGAVAGGAIADAVAASPAAALAGCTAGGQAGGQPFRLPGAPGQPQARDQTRSKVTLVWAPSAPGSCPITGYAVYRSIGGANPVRVATTTTVFATLTLPAQTAYTFYAVALDAQDSVSAASPNVTVDTARRTPAVAYQCTVKYAVSHWKGGFAATVSVTNWSRQPIQGWTLTLPLGGDQHVTSFQGADVSQDGQQLTVVNPPADDVIPPRGTVSFGIAGTWSASDARPGPATLNWLPCN